nr:uncharacterized protein LOC105341337 [Crassostrea gigas]
MQLMMAAKTIIRRYSDGSNDSLTLNLSYESSSFDESIDNTIPLGTRPYLFEPEVNSNEETTASSPQKSEMDDEERRENSECDGSNSSVNLTSNGSSSFEDFDSMIPLGSKPYLFEPEVSSDEESTSSKKSTHEMDDKERQGNNDWCMCGHCPPTAKESVCCQEIPQVKAVLAEDPGKPCITEHQGFHPVCLNPTVLRIAYYAYRQQYEKDEGEPETNRPMQQMGYRQLARWCWEWLGKHVRVSLPACAVHKIQMIFPEEKGPDQ